MNCSGLICHWRSIRFQRGSKAVSPGAWRWRLSRCCTVLIAQHSIWYPINLLAAGFLPAAMTDTTAKIAAFHLGVFFIAAAIHLITSLLVGLLYGAMLPMLPRRPILLGGLIAPLFWTGLIHSILGIVNPVLNQRIHWLWFVASQVAFGIVAGIVVSRQERIRTWQRLPLAFRSGMEASGHEGRKLMNRAAILLAVFSAGRYRLRHSQSGGCTGRSRRTGLWISVSSMRETVPDAMVRMETAALQLDLAIPSISPLPTMPRFVALPLTELPEPPCQRSRNTRAEC